MATLMPIKSLTDTPRPERGVPKLGNIRPGEKRKNKNGKEYPANLDYWRVTFAAGYEDLAAPFVQMYGEQPREFSPVFVIGRTAEEAFPNWMVAYNSSQTQIRKCDGEHIVQMVNEQTGRYQRFQTGEQPCICPTLAETKKPLLCSRRGWLNLILRDFSKATGIIGYFTVNTGSAANITMIWNTLYNAQALLGTLQGVPFVFGRGEPEERNVPFGDTGERRKVKESMFYMHMSPAFNQQVVIPMMEHFDAPQLERGYDAMDTPPQLPSSVEYDAPDGYLAVPSIKVEWDEISEFYTYYFSVNGGDDEAVYSGPPDKFIPVGLTSANTWEPGDVVTFDPPLLIKVSDEGTELGIETIRKYAGQITVDTPRIAF